MYGEGAVTDCVKNGLGSFMLETSAWTMIHGQVDSDQIETLIENYQCYTTWEIADILKTAKSIKLLMKMKNVSFIVWKKPYRLFGQPNSLAHLKSVG